MKKITKPMDIQIIIEHGFVYGPPQYRLPLNDGRRVYMSWHSYCGPLDEGQVVLQWPKNMSPDSFEDFEDWIGLVLRKTNRRR